MLPGSRLKWSQHILVQGLRSFQCRPAKRPEMESHGDDLRRKLSEVWGCSRCPIGGFPGLPAVMHAG